MPSSFVPSADTSLPSTVPVVAIFCEPKSGAIFVPAIAADAFTSALTIAPSAIFADVTALSAILAVVTLLSAILAVVTLASLIFAVVTAESFISCVCIV